MACPSFRVAIIGGGIGGLALANMLQNEGIDYILIEKGKELDPQVGASIGVLPNGARILDQIGCLDDLARLTVGMESTASHRADGSLIGAVSDTLKLMEKRTGYPVFFLDRQLLLRTLASRIKTPRNIRLSTTALLVAQNEEKATISCTDGTDIVADIVVGADGVHSLVRHEMWRHSQVEKNGHIFDKDQQAMSAEYKCLFGISNNIPGMISGQTDRTYAFGVSTLSYVGKDGRIFWFVFMKMDQVYYPPCIPKFNEEDVEAIVQKIKNLALRENGTVTIDDIYNSRICCSLVAIEEAKYQHWSYGRLVCMGDSIHKMTPNLGAGASSALESAAVLSNKIFRMACSPLAQSLPLIRSLLQEYHTERELRVTRAMAMTNKLTRVQALQTKGDYYLTHYIAPWADDYYAETFSNFVIGAPLVDFLPIPQRSLRGTMPFNPKQGWGYEENLTVRARRAWPLVMVALLSMFKRFSTTSAGPTSSLMDEHHNYRELSSPYHPAALDLDLAISISTASMYGLWLIESTRLNNKATLAQFSLLCGIVLQYFGEGVAMGVYFFALYVSSPIEKFKAADNRLTDTSYTRTTGLCIFLFGALPKIVERMLLALGSDYYEIFSRTWIPPFHLYWTFLVAAGQYFAVRFFLQSTIRSDRLRDVHSDVTPIRYNVSFTAMLTSTSWLYHVAAWCGCFAHDRLTQLSWPTFFGQRGTVFALNAGIWLTLAYNDLKAAGMTRTGWIKIFAMGLACLICLGPGTMLVIGWMWREEILIYRRHQDAVIERNAD